MEGGLPEPAGLLVALLFLRFACGQSRGSLETVVDGIGLERALLTSRQSWPKLRAAWVDRGIGSPRNPVGGPLYFSIGPKVALQTAPRPRRCTGRRDAAGGTHSARHGPYCDTERSTVILFWNRPFDGRWGYPYTRGGYDVSAVHTIQACPLELPTLCGVHSVHVVFAALLLFQDRSVEQLIEKLRSDNSGDRTEAREQLKKLGSQAESALEKASKDPDLNFSQEARQTLDSIRTGRAMELFSKIEATVQKAKTIRVTFKGQGEGQEGKTTSEGSGFLKEGNKVRIFETMPTGHGGTLSPRILSDGVTLAMPLGEDDPDKRVPPKKFSILVASALVRVGIGDAFMSLRHASMQDDPKLDGPSPDELWTVTDLKEGPDEAPLKTLLYKVKPIDRDVPLLAKLWYDPLTFIPRKHHLTFDNGTVKWTSGERYEELALNTDIPDERFAFTAAELAQMDMKVFQAKFFLSALGQLLEKYKSDTGSYPATSPGLQALVQLPQGIKGWAGPYIPAGEVPKDPWGNPFVYKYPGTRNQTDFDLLSSGPDGKQGTNDDVQLPKRVAGGLKK